MNMCGMIIENINYVMSIGNIRLKANLLQLKNV